MKEPIWLHRAAVLALHDRIYTEFGGGSGMREEGRLDAAIARPQQAYGYGVEDIAALAASYAVGIVQGHPFIDGNKRTGLVCAILFLEINGYRFSATEEDAVTQTLALASSELTEEGFAAWLKTNVVEC